MNHKPNNNCSVIGRHPFWCPFQSHSEIIYLSFQTVTVKYIRKRVYCCVHKCNNARTDLLQLFSEGTVVTRLNTVRSFLYCDNVNIRCRCSSLMYTIYLLHLGNKVAQIQRDPSPTFKANPPITSHYLLYSLSSFLFLGCVWFLCSNKAVLIR